MDVIDEKEERIARAGDPWKPVEQESQDGVDQDGQGEDLEDLDIVALPVLETWFKICNIFSYHNRVQLTLLSLTRLAQQMTIPMMLCKPYSLTKSVISCRNIIMNSPAVSSE